MTLEDCIRQVAKEKGIELPDQTLRSENIPEAVFPFETQYTEKWPGIVFRGHTRRWTGTSGNAALRNTRGKVANLYVNGVMVISSSQSQPTATMTTTSEPICACPTSTGPSSGLVHNTECSWLIWRKTQ